MINYAFQDISAGEGGGGRSQKSLLNCCVDF